jgi:phosphoesterase RecJ-like protein
MKKKTMLKRARFEQARFEQARFEQAHQLIQSAHSPLLICHVAPDGDAIGSLMGLGRALWQMGGEPILACSDPVPARFDFVPGVEAVVQEVNDPFDLVISLDSSDLRRLGHFSEMPGFSNRPLINIDHHLTNLDFGDVNLVDHQAASTTEVLLRLLEYMAVSIDARLATCLLTGLVTDTRGFRTNNVTPQVMDAVLQLMKAGASLPYIAQHTLDRRPTGALRLWGAALAQLRVSNGVIWTSIPLAMRRTVDFMGNSDTGLVSFLASADDVDVAVIFNEREDGSIEAGLRARPGFDVARVALQFGGGGHALASGCTISGPLEEAQDRLLTALRADLARQRQKRA